MKFLNVEFDKKLPKKLLLKHILFSFFWISGIAIFLFRVDFLLKLNLPGLRLIIPALYLFLLFFLIKNQKWYFTLAYLLYPILLIFWFIPKWILFKGKIYIFFYYANFIIGAIKNYRRAIFITFFGFILIVFLASTNSILVKIFSILFFSYIYFLFFKKFLKGIFEPSNFLEPDSKIKIEKSITPDSSEIIPFIKNLEVRKEDENLTAEVKEKKIRERLIHTHYFYVYLAQSLKGFRNERSYTMFCIFQLFLYFGTTVCYITYVNYELFKINSQLFLFTSSPHLFDFFYYSLKTVTFSSIDYLKPNHIITKLIEILSFLLLGIFLLIIIVSLIFSLQRQKLKELINESVLNLEVQTKVLSQHIEKKYGEESSSDEKYAKWIKNLLNKIF